MSVDIKEFFEQQLPPGMARNPEAIKKIDGTFQITVGIIGDWFVNASADGPNYVSQPDEGSKPDVHIVMAPEDFQKFMDNPHTNLMQLFFAGKAKCVGDTRLMMKLSDLVMVVSN